MTELYKPCPPGAERFFGVDPGGVKGGIALVDFVIGSDVPVLVQTAMMPLQKTSKVGKRLELDEIELASWLRPHVPVLVRGAIERVNAMPGEGVSSVARFLSGYGMARGILAGLGLDYSKPIPLVWKRAIPGWIPGQGKKLMTELASQIFADWQDQWRLVKHTDRAEAALIAWYARSVHYG